MKFQQILKRAAVGAALASAAMLAQAAAITYSFDTTGVAAFGAGPFGTVALVENGTGGVDFTVSLRADMNFVNTGNHSVFSLNASGVSDTDFQNIQFNGTAASALGFSIVSPGVNPPFGSTFTFMIDCTASAPTCRNGAPGQTADPLTFTVADALLSDFGFLVGSTTAFFAADVICNTGNCNGSTGAIGVTTTPRTPPGGGDLPEPMSLALVGAALLGAGAARGRATRG